MVKQTRADTAFCHSSLRTSSRNSRRLKLRLPARPGPDSDRTVVDLGNPLAGLLLGALMIAATMGGFFLWDNYQSGADAKAIVLIGEK